MRLALVGAFLLISGCAGTPTDSTQPLDRACSVSDCFLGRDVRDFDVLDQTTVIVYVGAQRCAFKVDLRGAFCDMTFAPSIYFRSTSNPETLQQQGSRDVFGEPTLGRMSDLRICSGDLKIDVSGGVFTETSASNQQPVDRFGNRRSECQISSVASLTDDQVLELYVAHDKVPPPPPMGGGQIEVGDQKGEGGDSAGNTATTPQPPPPSGEPTASVEARPAR